jgi:hypothetical protein
MHAVAPDAALAAGVARDDRQISQAARQLVTLAWRARRLHTVTLYLARATKVTSNDSYARGCCPECWDQVGWLLGSRLRRG